VAAFSSPLVRLLVSLTVVTGVVDAVSYLALGRVFVANMTGNVVFFGFSLAGASGFSVWLFVVALAGFCAGSAAGGRLARGRAGDRRRWLTMALAGEAILVGAAVGIAAGAGGTHSTGGGARYAAVAVLAAGMGIQNATARALAVPDLTTTVLTLTLTGLSADSALGSGRRTPPWRRIASVVAMLAGAAVGALLVLDASVAAALGLAAGALALVSLVPSVISRDRLVE